MATALDAARFVDGGGLLKFVDSAGRQWDLRAYCEMAAHTKLMIAKNEATRNVMAQMGVHHYQISVHGSDCPVCGPLEGEVFWTGEGDARGYGPGPAIPLHPNCGHATMPYVLEAHE
jgi:hypothetical protein